MFPARRRPRSLSPCLFLFLFSLTPFARAASCSIAQPHPLTPEEIAVISGDLSQAETLYRQKISQEPASAPGKAALIAGLVDTLLEEHKVDEAASTVKTALAATPQSVELLTALAEVQYRQGLPWEEEKTLDAAQKADICYPRLHLIFGQYFHFNSYYASSLREIALAHQLDPYDPEIRSWWIHTLPPRQRIDELKKYLAANDADINSVRRARAELAVLEHRMETHGSCHLVSTATTTDIPFTPILIDADRIRGWGLDVAFNDHKARLQVDTGAGGLYIGRSVAERAGLKPADRSEIGGIGDKGPQSGYTAYADSIKIGGLEFKNCLVEVSDRRDIVGVDGLIGMNVFSSFLVTLDFPWRKLTLSPLPPYPGTTVTPETLNTQQESASDASAAASSQSSGTSSSAPAIATSGPHDRYVAPEMKNWNKVYRIGHNMIVPTVLNNKTTRLFIIDTGAYRSSISPAAAREVTKVHSDYQGTVKGISGSVKNVYSGDDITVRFAHLQQEMEDVVSFDNTNLSNNLGTEISGFLGFDILHLLVVKIDYRDGLMDFDYSENRGYQHIR